MKIKSVVCLSTEELKTLNEAFEILENYHAESTRVHDPNVNLCLDAQTIYQAIDNFLLGYEATHL